jgi:hypothetical protein
MEPRRLRLLLLLRVMLGFGEPPRFSGGSVMTMLSVGERNSEFIAFVDERFLLLRSGVLNDVAMTDVML